MTGKGTTSLKVPTRIGLDPLALADETPVDPVPLQKKIAGKRRTRTYAECDGEITENRPIPELIFQSMFSQIPAYNGMNANGCSDMI